MDHATMKELPEELRPYERCEKEGPERLSDEELLSIILRTGSRGETSLELARRILALSDSGEGILGLLHLSLPQLTALKGIGRVKGIQLLCIGELSRRIWKRKTISRPVSFTEASQVAAYYQEDLRHAGQDVIQGLERLAGRPKAVTLAEAALLMGLGAEIVRERGEIAGEQIARRAHGGSLLPCGLLVPV